MKWLSLPNSFPFDARSRLWIEWVEWIPLQFIVGLAFVSLTHVFFLCYLATANAWWMWTKRMFSTEFSSFQCQCKNVRNLFDLKVENNFHELFSLSLFVFEMRFFHGVVHNVIYCIFNAFIDFSTWSSLYSRQHVRVKRPNCRYMAFIFMSVNKF